MMPLQTFVPTFEIYSVGDALYLQRVINGVAMMCESNLFLVLGTIGLLLGLVMMSVKAITSGLRQIELPTMLVSIILFFVMFGLKANITINDMVGSPFGSEGIATPPTVNNVPYGVAASSWLITTIGYHLAEKFEQAYGTPGSTFGSVTNGGFGKSLAWLNAVRNLEIPEIDNSDGTVATFKKNMSSYLTNCARVEANFHRINLDAARVAKNIMSDGSTSTDMNTAGGIGIQNKALTTEWIETTGTTITPCTSALLKLRAKAGDTLYNSAANALSGKQLKWLTSPSAQLDDAFEQIGMDHSHAQAYVTNMAVMSVWNEALSKNGGVTNMATAAMMAQAREQRATQWAGEESMFKSVARSFTAFFEGMIFACAPFMALAIGLGSLGWSMVMRYMILSAWVALWLPVLAIINLYQTTVLEHAVNAMLVNGQLNGTSAASTAYLAGRITEWVGTGAALAASTPAITLMLLMGGAVTATALMGRMQGGDFINEKLTSPDVANASPAMNQSSALTFDPANGIRQTGSDATIPVLRGDAAMSNTVSSSYSLANQTTENALKEAGRLIQSNTGVSNAFSATSTHGMSSATNSAFSSFASELGGSGFNVSTEGALQLARAAIVALSTGGSASIRTPGGAGKTAGASGNVSASGTSQSQETASQANKFLDALRSDTSKGHDLRFSLAKAINDSGILSSGTSTTHGQSTAGTDRFAKSWGAAKSAEDRYQQAAQKANQFTFGQSANVAQVARQLMSQGLGNDLVTSAKSIGGDSGFMLRFGEISNSGWGKDAPEDQRKVEAALLHLQKLSENGDAAASSAFTDALSASGMFVASSNMHASTDMHADSAAGLSPPGSSSSEIESSVGSQGLGSGTSSAAVHRAATGVEGSGTDTLSSNAARVGANYTDPISSRVLSHYSENPESVDPVLDDYLSKHRELQDAAATTFRDAQANAMNEADPGSMTRAAGWAADFFGSLALGKAPDASLVGGMLSANKGEPVSSLHKDPGGGPMETVKDYSYVNRSSELASNQDLRETVNSQFARSLASGSGMTKYQMDGAASPQIATALAAMETAKTYGGFTPELKEAFNSSFGSFRSDTQKTAFLDLVSNGDHANPGSKVALAGTYRK